MPSNNVVVVQMLQQIHNIINKTGPEASRDPELTPAEMLQHISDIIEYDGMIVGGVWSWLQSVGRGELPDDMVMPTLEKIRQAMRELSEHLGQFSRPDLYSPEAKRNHAEAVTAGIIPF